MEVGQASGEEDFECALCHELLYAPCVAPCAHVFCKPCLGRCLELGVPGSRRCPLCRHLLHATSASDLAACAQFARLLEDRFPEAYAARREAESSKPLQEAAVRLNGAEDELPLFVLDALLPRQRMRLNIFEHRYRALTRVALAGGRRFGMVGSDRLEGHHTHGVEVMIEECTPLADGRFHVLVRGTRPFRIVEEQLQPEGYLLATIAWTDPEAMAAPSAPAEAAEAQEQASQLSAAAAERQDQLSAAAAELQPLLEEWKGLARAERPHHLERVLEDLGPPPPASCPGDLAFWVAALVNPLPPLGFAPELRPAVLAAATAEERLKCVREGLDSSLVFLRALSKSPVRRLVRILYFTPPSLTIVAVVGLACAVSACSNFGFSKDLVTVTHTGEL